MKDWLTVQDYLFGVQDVGDWEGDEEQVADRMNGIYHAVWESIPADLTVEQINFLMQDIWDQLRGSDALLLADEEELTDWVLIHCRQYYEQCRDEASEQDDDAAPQFDEDEY